VEDENATLLIVEDDLDVAEMINAYFQVQGYDVKTVNWGEDGVRAANSTSPDLIILDIRLPDMTALRWRASYATIARRGIFQSFF
jgi:DNA-binding response OmpR family regulator